jgi:pyruvate-ferredoxin/flavodoxin oxidoreductase
MKEKKMQTIDGNTAAAHVAYAFSEVAAIYPITPSSNMGEYTDAWATAGRKNIFGETVEVIEMQSEAGAAGACHGSMVAGALTTTFTASQGLLLMIPNMYKIAGELLPTVFHVSARSLACQSLSIFGDHSDVMSVRNTGFALMSANSIQETHDLAIVGHLSTLESRIPFLNFFDGFRTSHEIQKVELSDYDTLKSMIDMKYIEAYRQLALRPENPMLRVGQQGPDVYFQGRETVNKFYDDLPNIVKRNMKKVEEVFGRKYNLFDYVGAKDAEKLIIAMGSACETIEETIDYLVSKNEKVGLLKVRLYRPFSIADFIEAIPTSVKKIAVLDRTKEPGSIGEPLYLDTVTALRDKDIIIIGGRYGLSSKEFTPSMVKAVYDHLDGKCTHNFTVGINDDVTNTSIEIKDTINTEPEGTVRCKFWGVGSDGTVGANKNSIKIIGDNTDLYAQGYFAYDSKKSGGITVSHLRFGKKPIKSEYLLTFVDFVALHVPAYIGRYDILEGITEGGTFLLNSPFSREEAFKHLTRDMQETIIKKKVKFYTIDAAKIANEVGLGTRINTVMQAAFFKVSGVLPEKEAISLIKKYIEKTFIKKGEDIVKMNWNAVDKADEALVAVAVPETIAEINSSVSNKHLNTDNADDFTKNIIEPIMRLQGDSIKVSEMPIDGRVPTATSKIEKRAIALEVPCWIDDKCIQCGQCVLVCPHAAIRMKQVAPEDLKNAPANFSTLKSTTKNDKDLQFRIQVYTEDCQGCGSCAQICVPKEKALEMKPIQTQIDNNQVENQIFFDELPDNVVDGIDPKTLKGSQFKKPLFEFSGACAGCGETPYVKLITQLFGERMVIANATGCSSIYGGTFPTVPYCTNKLGYGPVWANSLFEDNAEFGLGMRLAVNTNRKLLKSTIGLALKDSTVSADLKNALEKNIELWTSKEEEAILAQENTKSILAKEKESSSIISRLKELQDYFVDKSVWILGGDGWAYDIGFGGLDHVLASGNNVNVLVLDTEVYSNTGGQASKSTPRAAVAQFAASGKQMGKKNLGLMMTTYGNIYVASVNMGANKNQVLKAMAEAEAYDGPSIIIAYSPCIAHGINMKVSQEHSKMAADTGYWPIYRYNPTLLEEGKNPFTWESKAATKEFSEIVNSEIRYKSLKKTNPEEAKRLLELAIKDNTKRLKDFENLK